MAYYTANLVADNQRKFCPTFFFALTEVVSVSVLLFLFDVSVMSGREGRHPTGNLRHSRSKREPATSDIIWAHDVESLVLQ